MASAFAIKDGVERIGRQCVFRRNDWARCRNTGLTPLHCARRWTAGVAVRAERPGVSQGKWPTTVECCKINDKLLQLRPIGVWLSNQSAVGQRHRHPHRRTGCTRIWWGAWLACAQHERGRVTVLRAPGGLVPIGSLPLQCGGIIDSYLHPELELCR